jgi:hypothetical protein
MDLKTQSSWRLEPQLMSQQNNNKQPSILGVAKEWIDALALLPALGGVLGNLIFEALPLAPTLRPIASFIAIAFCLVAYLCTHSCVRAWQSDWRKRCVFAWIWIGVFVVVGVIPYRLLLGYLEHSAHASWYANLLVDILQSVIYAAVFAFLSIALTIGFSCIRRSS